MELLNRTGRPEGRFCKKNSSELYSYASCASLPWIAGWQMDAHSKRFGMHGGVSGCGMSQRCRDLGKLAARGENQRTDMDLNSRNI